MPRLRCIILYIVCLNVLKNMIIFLNKCMNVSGSVVGQCLSDHPDVRKLGFTGSTEIGKQIMKRSVNFDPRLQTQLTMLSL